MKQLIFLIVCLFSSFSFYSQAEPSKSTEITTITLEYASTQEQRRWGLMQRTSMPQNHGMIFFYPIKQQISLWSFNCYLNLSVGFLDEGGVIQEIVYLKAFPEIMDPKRPIHSIADLEKYPINDPIIQFYVQHGIVSKKPCHYALEMNASFFRDDKIQVGDIFSWDGQSTTAQISKRDSFGSK